MAPERFRGEADARADVYALGLTLYELLTLRPAFDSPDRLTLIEQIKNADPPRPRSLDPRIPRDLETVVLKAIEKDPRARYAVGRGAGRGPAAVPGRRAGEGAAGQRRGETICGGPVGTGRSPTLGGFLTAVLVASAFGGLWAAAYFRESARRESSANQQSQLARKAEATARGEAERERDRSRRLSAGLALDKGIALAEAGDPARGLVWMLEALEDRPRRRGRLAAGPPSRTCTVGSARPTGL